MRLNQFIEGRMFALVLCGVAMGWFFPALAACKPAVSPLFAYMTFVTSLNISWRSILKIAAMPGPVLLILGLVHMVMPVVSVALAAATLDPGSPVAVGLVLAAIIPNAVTSVIWTGLAKGEVPLALTAVTLDSLLSPLLVPFLAWLFLGRTVHLETGLLFMGMLQMIVLPTLVGVTLRDLTRDRLGRALLPLNAPLSKLALMFVVAINLAAARESAIGLRFMILPVMALILLQTLLAFLLGYGASKAMQWPRPTAAAVTFCVGLRNLTAGAVLAMQYFPPAASLPTIAGFLFQQPLAALFRRVLLRGSGEEAPLEAV